MMRMTDIYSLQVIELLCELPNITWAVPEGEAGKLQVRGSDCCTLAPLHLMNTVTVPARTSGTLVSTDPLVITWQTPSNAWQVLLAIMNLLDHEVRLFIHVVHLSHCLFDEW